MPHVRSVSPQLCGPAPPRQRFVPPQCRGPAPPRHASTTAAGGDGASTGAYSALAAPFALRYLYNSDRVAQVMGSGLLAVSTRANHLHELFPEGKEMVFADTVDEMLETVRRYKRDDQARRAIAEAGWRKSHAEYSVDLVTRYIEEVVFERMLSHPYQWPTTLYSGE